MQFLDLGAHLHAQFGVEIGQRLVEEKYRGITYDRPAHGDTLPLAAGKLARIAGEIGRNVQDLGSAPHAALDLRLRRRAAASAETHVFSHRLVRVERIVLKDHGDVAVFRGEIINDALADPESFRPLIVSRPAIIRSSVDFPQPDGPTKMTNSPSATEIDTP